MQNIEMSLEVNALRTTLFHQSRNEHCSRKQQTERFEEEKNYSKDILDTFGGFFLGSMEGGFVLRKGQNGNMILPHVWMSRHAMQVCRLSMNPVRIWNYCRVRK